MCLSFFQTKLIFSGDEELTPHFKVIFCLSNATFDSGWYMNLGLGLYSTEIKV